MSAPPTDRALYDGRYRVERILGRGPSGIVYQVADETTGASRALKRLHAQFHDEALLAAVQRDAVAAGALQHPGVLAPIGTGFYSAQRSGAPSIDEDSGFFLVTELFPGEPLQALLQRGALPPRDALRVFQPLCAALDAAHHSGLAHGDLTPTNVMCAWQGGELLVQVADFGMHRLAASGAWHGAAAYLPPEVYRGEVQAADARWDVFALGALLYECLSGQRLFDGPSTEAVMFKVCMMSLPSLAPIMGNGGMQARLEAVLSMACAKDPAARFDSAAALLRALEAVLMPAARPAAAHEVLPAVAPVGVPVAPVAAPAPASPDAAPVAAAVAVSPVVAPPGPVQVPPPRPALPLLPPTVKMPTAQARRGPDTLETWAAQQQTPAGQNVVTPSGLTELEGDLLKEAEPQGAAQQPLLRLAVLGGLAMTGLLLCGIAVRDRLRSPAQQPPAAASTVTAAPRPAAGPTDSGLLLAAEDRFAQRDYAGALSRAEELLSRAPHDPAAQDLQRRAGEALRLSGLFDGFARAAERGDADTALALYREFPRDSGFRARAQAQLAGLRDSFAAAHLEIAQAAARTGACDEVQRQVGELRQAAEPDAPPVPALERAQRLLQHCQEQGEPRAEQPRPQGRGEQGAEARPSRGAARPDKGRDKERRPLKDPFAGPQGKRDL